MKEKHQPKTYKKPVNSNLQKVSKSKNIDVKAEEEAMNYEWRKHPGGG